MHPPAAVTWPEQGNTTLFWKTSPLSNYPITVADRGPVRVWLWVWRWLRRSGSSSRCGDNERETSEAGGGGQWGRQRTMGNRVKGRPSAKVRASPSFGGAVDSGAQSAAASDARG